MANDRSDDTEQSGMPDPDEVRLVSRDDAVSPASPAARVTRESLRAANRAARLDSPATTPESEAETTRQISMQIGEEGFLDLRSGEERELGSPAPSQPRLPSFKEPVRDGAQQSDTATHVIDPNSWLSALGTASGLGTSLDDMDDEPTLKVGAAYASSRERSESGESKPENEEPPTSSHALPGEKEADGKTIVSPSGAMPGTHPEAPTSPEVAGGEPGEGRRFRDDDRAFSDKSMRSKAQAFADRTKEARVSLPKRIGTGLAFAVAAIAAFAAGPTWTLVLVSAVLLFAAVEYFDGLRRVGFKPATALGLLAVFGCTVAAYTRGEQGLLFVAAASVFFTLTWYLAGIVRQAPTANIAVTLLGIFWIGVLGSFAGLLLRMPDRQGMTLLIGAVLVTAAYDTAAYAGGVMFGKRKLAPSISPTKSWEGLVAGTAAAIITGGVVVSLMSPWSLAGGLILGLVVALLAPLGDLAESMVKRDLGLKDMGRILPGHGGVLDRFDALLLVLPGTFYLATFLIV